MSSSDSPSVDELVARKMFVGSSSIVTIPGWSALSEAKRHAICAKLAVEQQIAPPLDVEALQHALRNLPQRSPTPTPTPPPDDEEDNAFYHEVDKKARKDLEEDDCPPCYPKGLGFPLQHIPEEYEEIVSYWNSLSGTGPSVLSAQLSDWRSFRNYQERIRRYHLQRKSFTIYQEKVRDRRRRHGYEANGYPHPDQEQQSKLENWIEFQNYHLAIHERIEEDLNSEREKLRSACARKQSEDADPSGLQVARDAEVYEYRLKYAERRLRQHESLLRWTEQQRIVMAAERIICVDDTGGYDDQDQARRVELKPNTGNPAPGYRKRDRKARSVLNPLPSGVSKKCSPKHRCLRPRKRDVPLAAENARADSSAPLGSSLRIPNLREKKARREKESTPLHPFRPQRVSKTAKKAPTGKPSADVHVKSRSAIQLQAERKQHSADGARNKQQKRMQPSVPSAMKTRSGRISKRPGWFCPG
ncbi:hypothetical protein MMC22_003592 [Lobaria immixta]|nr:hypothetical protein [Lobaria immixta]